MIDVVLDPGHGGGQARGNSTPDGARFGTGELEQQINFALAHQIARHLGGAEMTRGEHENRSLAERVDAARSSRARTFVSVHASPRGGSGVWVHSRAAAHSVQLAESIRAQLAPAYGAVEVSRGELAVLSPDRHALSTAACLVDVGLTGRADAALEPTAAAIARGVRGHLASAPSYGRGAPARVIERGLDNAPILPSDPIGFLRALADWTVRQITFRIGITDTSFFPFSAICKIVGTYDDGSAMAGGTAFYVGNNCLLTAGHVVKNVRSGARLQTATITPGMNGTRPSAGAGFSVSGTERFIPHPSYTGSSDFDMGVIKVDTPPPAGQFFLMDATPASYGLVCICGYAAYLNDAGTDRVDETQQHLDTDTIRSLSDSMDVFDYNAITGWGTSGAPVFYSITSGGRPSIAAVAVHVSAGNAAGTRGTPLNAGCRITDDKLRWILSV